MELGYLLQIKYPGINLVNKVVLQDDGNGNYIKVWDEEFGPKPTDEDIIRWESELQVEYNNFLITRARVYPSIGEQLDMLWHSMNEGEIPKANEFYETIKLVKDNHPKEE